MKEIEKRSKYIRIYIQQESDYCRHFLLQSTPTDNMQHTLEKYGYLCMLHNNSGEGCISGLFVIPGYIVNFKVHSDIWGKSWRCRIL